MIRVISFAFFSIIFLNCFCFSQERKDLGVQVGGSYYMGDYNYGKPLYQASPSAGAMFRHNINNFYSLRLSLSYAMLRGSYSSFNHYLPGITASFNKHVIESDFIFEMNFMPFNTKHLKKNNFAPYVAFGAGGAYVGGSIIPQLPFAIGIKYCPLSRLTIGWEWRVSKTFTDKIDGYNNVYDGSKAIFHNNDWHSFVGIYITYRLHNNKFTCPVYE